MMNRQTASQQRFSPAQREIALLIGDSSETVRDPLWKDIALSPAFKELLHSPVMQKLSRIKQLGPAHLLYPGAVHTRLDHSLGVFHVSRMIILSLLTAWANADTAIPLTHEGIQALLAASMLHDLGHFPYAHALKDIVIRQHESLGSEIIAKDKTLQHLIGERLHTSVNAVCQIIDASMPCEDTEILFYRSLLSGTLDPDKLDYLSRDALFCGVPYGMQDASYIIRRLAYAEPGYLAVPYDAIGSVEHLLFSKYLMYQNVYWHHTTRCATAMIKKGIYLAIRGGVITESDVYNLDDESFLTLPLRFKQFVPLSLITHVRDNQLFSESARLSFNENNKRHAQCAELQTRLDREEELFRRLVIHYPWILPYQVIVDIPEDVSFEAQIPILFADGTIQPFASVDELFTPAVVHTFTASLRKIRLFTPAGVEHQLAQRALEEVLETHHD